MIRPIYAQASSKTGKIGKKLQEALSWWWRVLDMNISEECSLIERAEKGLCRLYVDAASTPAHCAAVLFMDGQVIYTNAAPEQETMQQLATRNDKQITSLVSVATHLATH